jgi:hypothetical protein
MKMNALESSDTGHYGIKLKRIRETLERVKGIEPSFLGYNSVEARVGFLPSPRWASDRSFAP